MKPDPNDPRNGCCVPAPTDTQPAPPKAVPTVTEQYAEMGKTHTGALPTFPTKAARVAFFRAALSHQRKFAYRALEIIFEYQTADEQQAGVTVNLNGVGFTGVDAEILTSFAKQLAAKKARFPNQPAWLSEKQTKLLFRKIVKYAKQLIRVLEARGIAGIEIVKPTKKEAEQRAA